MNPATYGAAVHGTSGRVGLTDVLIERLAGEAEEGYSPDQLISRIEILGCPDCGDTEHLRTIERLFGDARINEITREEGRIEVAWTGETDIDWDSSETVGIECYGCEWRFEGYLWGEKLKVIDP